MPRRSSVLRKRRPGTPWATPPSKVYALLALLAATLALTGCDPKGRTRTTPTTSQPTRPTPPTAPPTTRPELPSEDDVRGGEVALDSLDPSVIPDVDLPAGPNGAVVSLLLPTFGDRFAGVTLPQNAQWGLGYYAGVRLALEELERAGERGTVHVFDTRGDVGATQALMRDPDLRTSHAVIGPYLTETARAAATVGQGLRIPLVVPYSAASNLADDYPRLVQLNPGLLRHLDAIAAYLHDNYLPEQVVLVGLPTGEQNREVAYLQARHRELDPAAPAWRTWQLGTADVGMQDLEWEGKFVDDGGETVFVFPISRRPRVVLSFLSQLQIGRAGRDATVFGMPQWSGFDQLDPTILEDLGVLITAGLHVDEDDPAVRRFRDSYIDRYGALPELAAYLGYDAMRLVLPLANQHGRDWVSHLGDDGFDGLASDYRLVPVAGDNGGAAAERTAAKRYENAAVRVLRYEDYRFAPVDTPRD